MDKGEAYRTLGLEDGAPANMVETRFANLSRRLKNGEDLDAVKIEEAYALLAGIEKFERNESAAARLYRKFMVEYKGWAILILFSAAVLAMVIVPMFFRRVPDLTVSFAGRYGFIDQDIMDSVLEEKMPDTEDILVEVMYLDEDGDSAEYDSGGRTRLSGLLISEEADILVMDAETYNFVRADNALMPLDDLIDRLGVEVPGEMLIYGVDFETGEKKVYGISGAELYLVDRTVYGADEKIICIARTTGHYEECAAAIKILLTYGE